MLRGLDAWAWGVLALLAGLLLTARIGHVEWAREHLDQSRVFQSRADAVELALVNQLRACEMLVRSMQALYLTSGALDAAQFKAAYENLQVADRLPSLQGLSLAERKQDEEGLHYIVELVEPAGPANAYLQGFDIATQPASLAAARRSRDTDTVVMSAPFRLRQAPQQASGTSGMVLRLPAFLPGDIPRSVAERRAREHGSLGASFMIEALVGDAMASSGVGDAHLSVFDVTDAGRVGLYDNGVHVTDANAARTSRDIRFGERTWRIEMIDAGSASALPSWLRTTLFGVLSSLLFGALAWVLVGARRRAMELAKSVSARYRASEERFRRLNDLLPTLVLLFDRGSGQITYANQTARLRLGIAGAGTPLAQVAPDLVTGMLADAETGREVGCEAQLAPVAGEPFWARIAASRIELGGQPTWLLVASDTSEQRRLTERLSFQASHDSLTRLLNRQEFETRVKQALAAGDDAPRALLFIDLDQFKLINDTSGHIAGDQLLVQLSMKMRQQLRDQDLLARLGGDEFGVLLTDIAGSEDAMAIAERLRAAVDGHVFVWDQRSHITSCSIGGTLFRGDNTSLKELLAQVDTACYMAKDAGRNRVHFYSDDDAALRMRRSEMDWVDRIRMAMDESRLVLAYQELQAIGGKRTGEVGVRIELLLRMINEAGLLVLPGAFLPAAERYGLMPKLDRWVIDTALAHFDLLHPVGAELALCSINLSAASLEDEGAADYILDAIRRYRIAPGKIMFEITETAAVRDLARAAALIARLRQAGCRIALDDFGAGMSSFGYLKHLGVDTIKIDGAFVTDIESDAVSHSIVRAIAEIGHQHGLDVVAEWVAGPEQVEVLAKLGVDYVQGFGIHRPELARYCRP